MNLQKRAHLRNKIEIINNLSIITNRKSSINLRHNKKQIFPKKDNFSIIRNQVLFLIV